MSYGTMARPGGKIEVESEKGNGATFNLSIPIRKGAVQKVVPPEHERRVTGKKLHILVVDDNKDICDIVDGVLTRGGHAVTSVDNGAEAIELAGEKDFDLILCDLLMPNVQGYDVVKALNKLDKIPKIGLMTGWADLKPIDEEGTKVDFILKKPFKHAELAKHIDELDIPA
jgi:CheY-like chemotaxis protein